MTGLLGAAIIYLPITFTLLLGFASAAHAQRNVSPQRECATCHVMWLTDFNRKDVTPLLAFNPTPTVSTGKQDVASTERMCFSCHDGFALDSRSTWVNRHNLHPVGVKPSDKVKIPTKDGKQLFPLNADGKVYCGTCHTAHGVDWAGKDKGKRSPIFMRAENTNSSLCMSCHLERGTGPVEGNHPVLKQTKDVPEHLRAAGAKFAEGGLVVCESCHRAHGAPEKKLLVVKNENSELCGTCHADRYAKDLAQAGSMSTHPVNIRPVKAKVPQDLLDKGARHGTEGKIICQTCHRPHFAQADAKLLVAPNPQSELCKTCHIDQRRVASSKHNIALLDETAKNSRGREVGRAGVCSACHLPHGGSGPKMWAQTIKPGASDPMAELCLSCHRDGGLAEKKQVGTHTHPVGREMASLKGPVELPGYSPVGVKTMGTQEGRVSCASCHDPHQWDPHDPEKTSKPGDASDASNKFLRKANGPESELCLTCHKNKVQIKNTKHDLAVMFPQERNSAGQTSAEAGVCANCHQPHNGKGPRMWAREPLSSGDPVSSTCLSCHNPRGLAKDKQIGVHSHPVGAPVSNIGITAKDGKWTSSRAASGTAAALQPMPLYDAHGAPATEGGNVACGTCHDPHNWSAVRVDAGQDPRKIDGSGKSSFLRLPNDDKATLCVNCHQDKAAIALSKHNLAIAAPENKNSKGKTAAETGPCGACHLPHNGSGSRMWAMNPGTGQDEIEKKCTSCHREGHAAKNKLTGANSHPLRVDPKKLGVQTTLPLYTSEGKRDDVNGKLACATCHDLHQWKPKDAAATGGASASVEGDATDSFLRLPAAPQSELCVNCHQDQRWVNNTKHDLGVTASAERNGLKQTRHQSGLCGSCHVPHNALEKIKLWARPAGKANDGIEGLCRSCHSADKVAAAKQPLRPNHPPQVTALSNSAMRRDGQDGNSSHFPVFTKDGQKTHAGIITCATCHNSHQWSAAKAEEGSGKNTEGTNLNSFLRSPSTFSLCTNCHGLDSLFRYKFFHAESSRLK